MLELAVKLYITYSHTTAGLANKMTVKEKYYYHQSRVQIQKKSSDVYFSAPVHIYITKTVNIFVRREIQQTWLPHIKQLVALCVCISQFDTLCTSSILRLTATD
jgi:hypothetical protein